MKKKELKRVNMTLVGKLNRMVGKGIFALEIGFDSLALGARTIRDLFYTFASRSAKLAKSEGDMKDTFEEVDSFVDSALGR